jgi:hypothetical protein
MEKGIPTGVAEGAADGVAALQEELDDPLRDEAARPCDADHLLPHPSLPSLSSGIRQLLSLSL